MGARSPGEMIGGLMVAGAAGLFGAVVVLGRSLAHEVPVTTLLAVRFGSAAAILALVLVAGRRRLRPARGEGWRILFLGAIGYAGESALFFLALERGTAATVTLLFYTFPVWVAALAAVVGRGLPGLLLGGALLAAVAGAGIVVGTSGGLDITGLGIIFSLGSAVAISVYLVAYEALVRRTPPLVASMWVALGASLAQATVSLISGTGALPASGTEWITILAMGALTAGAFGGLLVGVQRLGALRTSIISSLEPVFAAVLGLLFLAEALRPGVLVGGLLILGAAVTASLARTVREPEEALP